MYKRLIGVLLSLTVLFCSVGCSDYTRLEYKSYELKNLSGFSVAQGVATAQMQANIEIANPTSSRFRLKDFNAVLHKTSGKDFAEVTLDDVAAIEPHSDGFVPVVVNVTVFNPMAAIFSAFDPSQLTADIEMKVSSGMATKRLRYKDVPLDELLGRLSATNAR